MTQAEPDNIFKSGPAVHALCSPYIIGARLQIERYMEAESQLKHAGVNAAYRCIHEVSSLYEDLDMIRRYTRGLGIDLWDDKLCIADVRNAIRHDIREEVASKNNRKQTSRRAEKLKLKPGLQFELGFSSDGISVGEQNVKLKEISHYVDVAEKLLWARSFGLRETYEDESEKKK